MKRVTSQINAFTLLETLLTLSISCFLILLFSVTFQKTVHVVRGEIFVLQFENILKNQQAQAVTKAEMRSLSSSNGIVMVDGADLHVPKETQFSDFSIAFKENGNLQSIRSAKIVIFLPYEGKEVTYQLQLGSGQYRKTTN
ncbi:competence protein [Lactococcus hodotermopsidis]|uniref:Competence protein n=1 Tax=Pseudolactococcus hodotermopsidis TaxID=2709157 RepID=A0A6A0BF38_9LACT|nr:competence type IV pilus minor pilin ComGD [Lactococcus hodotermopsidis]GFH42457.1 competence protein [Lactococcus hodotermopsidis]